jgi:hypothetical protein
MDCSLNSLKNENLAALSSYFCAHVIILPFEINSISLLLRTGIFNYVINRYYLNQKILYKREVIL